jgi:hypothetical protein
VGVVRCGLSLIHPLQRDIEVVIEAPNEAVTDSKVVHAATVDEATRSTGPLAPHSLVYIVGGDLRLVPLAANGEPPAGRVQRASTSSACRFVLDAIDHARPERSRFVIATAGADGRCGTSDDARAEVRLDALLGPVLAPWTGALPQAVLRDKTTLAPRGWVTTQEARLWAEAAPDIVQPLRSAASPLQRAVMATPGAVLVESSGGLSVVEAGSGNTFSEKALAGLAGGDWQAIGFDPTHLYLYRNVSNASARTWSVARIHRASLVTTVLANGAGDVALAGLGRDVLYTTVVNGNTLELRRLRTAVAGPSEVLASGALAESFFSVLTGADGVHMMWRASGLGSAQAQYRVDIIDEQGSVLRNGGAGGFSLGLADAGKVRFEYSDSRTRFLFAEGYGARLFGDASLVAYDGAARTAVEVGRLPGNAEFGAEAVFANVAAAAAVPATGFAVRTAAGVLHGDSARVFSFDAAQAASLVLATRRQ